MRHFNIPTYSPDGFASATPARQRDVVANAHSTIASLAEASRRMDLQAESYDADDRYDDGLVHSHGWARSSEQ